jgi:thymidylate kinase
MDRYIYDELANLPLSNPWTRAYVRLVQALVPRPDLAYLLDADPETAHQRKPEYPVDFMRECRAAYHRLAAMLGTMTLIPPLPLEDAKQTVEAGLDSALRELGSVPVSTIGRVSAA